MRRAFDVCIRYAAVDQVARSPASPTDSMSRPSPLTVLQAVAVSEIAVMPNAIRIFLNISSFSCAICGGGSVDRVVASLANQLNVAAHAFNCVAGHCRQRHGGQAQNDHQFTCHFRFLPGFITPVRFRKLNGSALQRFRCAPLSAQAMFAPCDQQTGSHDQWRTEDQRCRGKLFKHRPAIECRP